MLLRSWCVLNMVHCTTLITHDDIQGIISIVKYTKYIVTSVAMHITTLKCWYTLINLPRLVSFHNVNVYII
jgi:hypothetical protein